MSEPLTVSDYERLAEGILEEGALGYFAGGACDERTLRENVEAWRRYRLRPRVLVDVEGTTAATTVLGTEVSMPVLVAPTAFHRMAHPDGEAGTARAAAAVGTIMCLSTIATSTPAEVAAAAPDAPRWFQLYVFRDRGVTTRARRPGRRVGLRRDRAHGRRTAARPPRARPPHRLPGARGRARPERLGSGRRLGRRDAARGARRGSIRRSPGATSSSSSPTRRCR